MWKLISLEWKKYHTKKYIVKQAVVFVILGILFFAMCYYVPIDAELGISESVPEVEIMKEQIELLTNLVFLVFTSSMMSSFIIKAYINKTQSLMFCYPISRKKIILSQMMAVWIFCAAALFLGKLSIYLLLALSSKVGTGLPLGYDLLSATFYLQIFLRTVFTVTLAFIPIYIGKMMMSSRAVIITSFLLFSVMNGNIGDLTLRANTILPVFIFGVSLICGFLTVHNVEREDVM